LLSVAGNEVKHTERVKRGILGRKLL